MFASKFRLPARTQFPKVSSQMSFFTFKYAKNSLEYNRYGFAASKKLDKRSSVRNRVKRQLRAVLESLHPTLSQGYDLLFVLRSPILKASQEQMSLEIVSVLKKSDIFA